MSPLLFPKSRPRILDADDRKADRKKIDDAESAKVKVRSGGRCEVFVIGVGRCKKRANAIHHMLGGSGVRGRGKSALMIHKQHVCDGPHGHHRLITGHALKVLSEGPLPLWSDPYEEVE